MMGCLGEIGIVGCFGQTELDKCARMFGFSKFGHEWSCIILAKPLTPEGYF